MKKPTDEELICSHWDETLFESQEDDDSVTIGHRQVRRPAARRSLVTSSEDLGRSAVASDVHAAEGVSIESAALDTDKTGRFERIIVCGAPELGRALHEAGIAHGWGEAIEALRELVTECASMRYREFDRADALRVAASELERLAEERGHG